MNTAATVAVLTALVAVTAASRALPFQQLLLERGVLASPELRIDDNPDCKGTTVSCSNCTHRIVCSGLPGPSGGLIYVKTGEEACPAQQYCNSENGQCSRTLPAGGCGPGGSGDGAVSTPVLGNTLRCFSTGYFPNPTDCRKYHFCNNSNGDWAFDYDCTPYGNTVYDHSKKMCVPANQAACPRPVFNCRNQEFVLYAPYQNVYASCALNAVQAVSRCERDDFRLNVRNATAGCQRYCQTAGRFEALDLTGKPEANAQYYECISVGNGLAGPILRTCPDGSTFDKAAGCIVRTRSDGSTGSS